MTPHYIAGYYEISGVAVPMISTTLQTKDFLGAVMVRWGINRDNYRVNPGLYAVGMPGPYSDVLVTANYKLTFDTLRKNLSGLSLFILVLDTKGVNVWCAAGKGTFGTKELVKRILQTGLEKFINHKRLILPQLGATGIAAHRVKEECGFNVIFGPVRSGDIREFIENRYRADKKMRKIEFGFSDRMKLIPNDFVYGKYYFLGAIIIVSLISFLTSEGISADSFGITAFPSCIKILIAYISGVVVTPMLLPWIPARRFSLKGFYTGTTIFIVLVILKYAGNRWSEILAWFFIITSISSFMAMNFTGSTTFTSLSGVKKEMKISLPLQIGFAAAGVLILILSRLLIL
jgi:hypothetical protein